MDKIARVGTETLPLDGPGGDRMAAMIGTLLSGRYRLDAEVGRGGMGRVYRAHDTLLERDVAVKVLLQPALDSENRARLLREAQAAAGLNHPNIASVHDAGEVDGSPFVVMELVEGPSLHEQHPEALDDIVAVACQVCAALEHAHAHGIVHRDLKPENVLLALGPQEGIHPLTGTGGTAKLVDFGLARSMASRLTREGTITGSVFYLAPELALGQAYDGRADLYALGVMLYELTTGRLPFLADDPVAVISQHLHAPVVPPRAKNAGIPPALDRLIVHLLRKNPEDRPSSAAEVLRLLDSPELLGSEDLPAEEISVLERIERGRMVGRERELREARALWSQALSGRGGMLLVSGEPGIGKTRLVRELATQAEVSGGRALLGACYAEGGVPYAPFAQILQQALDVGVYEGLNLPEFVLVDLLTLAPALRLRFPAVPADASAALPSATLPTATLGTGGTGRTSPALDDPRAELHRLFESLVLLFAALSEQSPLLLVLEDAHWAGSGTLFLLRHLARQMQRRRVMIVATYRQVELDAARPLHEVLLDLQRERLATRLKLPRLDREQTRELLAVLFDEEVTPEYLAGIYAETEGNPFFIEEVCKALVESGRQYFQDGRWHRPSMEELGIPQSVRVAIQSRLNVLPAEAQETLRLAAILGREFEFDILAEASDQDEGVLIEALEDAERALLIEKVSAEAGGTFALVHSLIASTLIESTRTLQRRLLHRRAAAAIEARRPGDSSRLEALAHHYSEAGEGEKAVNYLLQAGDQARVLYAHREAIDHYQQALQYLKEQAARSEEPERDLGRAARTLMKLGLTYHNAYEFRAARQAYEEGFALWQRAGEAEPAVPLPPAPHALRIKTVHPFRILDPTMADAGSAVAVMQLFSGLVELAPEMDVVPGVSRSWEVLEGGRKYVFHLRNDVRWSDGALVVAGDFEYAWKRLLDLATGASEASLLYDITGAKAFHRGEGEWGDVGVHARDEVTLAVELEEPTGYWLHLLTVPLTYPLPRHVVEAHGKAWTEVEHIVTNGPFRLESWQPGRSLTLSRNPEYRGRFPGNIQRVEVSSQVDPLAPDEAGSVDVLFGFRLLKTIDSALRQQHGEIYVSQPGLATDYLGLNPSRPPLDDPRVRRAFALAIDRETLSYEDQWGGFPATGGFVPPGMPGHSPGIGLPYDPDAARQLLAEAGYPEGSGFPVFDSLAQPGNAIRTTYLQEQWREVLGVEMAWHIVEPDTYFDVLAREWPHMFLITWIADYPDPYSFLRLCIGRRSRWRNEVYDELVAAARGAMDQEKRLKLYQKADRILVQEAPIVPLLYGCWHWLQKPWVRKLTTSPMAVWHYKDTIIEPH